MADQAPTPNSFAEAVWAMFEGAYGISNERYAVDRFSGAILSFTKVSKTQLRKTHYHWQINDAIARIRVSTWRFFDVVDSIVRMQLDASLSPRAFDHFYTEGGVPINETGFTDRKLLLFHEEKPALLEIMAFEDPLYARVTLFKSALAEEAGAFVAKLNRGNSSNTTRWDGFTRFDLPDGDKESHGGLQLRHDLTAIVTEYFEGTPGMLRLHRHREPSFVLSSSPLFSLALEALRIS